MKSEKLQNLILDYLDGNLAIEKKQEFREQIEKEGLTIDELLELKMLTSKMDRIEVPEPSHQMTKNFYAMLQEESRKTIWQNLRDKLRQEVAAISFAKFSGKLAYGAIALFIGLFIGFWFTTTKTEKRIDQMSQEMQQVKEVMILAMLDKPHAAERIKALNVSSELQSPNQQIIGALIHTMNSDPNDNVRLSAVEALMAYADKSYVRDGLMRSLPEQESPLVQLALVEQIAYMGDTDSIPYLNELLNKEGLNETVKGKVIETIEYLT